MSPIDFIAVQAINLALFVVQATITVAVGATVVALLDRAWRRIHG